MHTQLRQDALAAGLNPDKVFALAHMLDTPEDLRYVVNYPKPSGTKERRKRERQRKRLGRLQNRKKR